MKAKKSIFLIVIVFIVALLLMQTTSLGADKTLKAQKLRKGSTVTTPYAYKLNQKDVWKIYEDKSGTPDYSQAIYCLAAGVGNLWSGNAAGVTYSTSQDMKNAGSRIAPLIITNRQIKFNTMLQKNAGYKAVNLLGAGTTNGSILWLLDNFYLSEHADEEERVTMREALLKAAFADRLNDTTLTPAFTLEDITLTDDDIEVVQQWALWQFTTDSNIDANYTTAQFPEMYIATGTSDATLGEYSPLSDLGRLLEDTDPKYKEGLYRQEDAEVLFDYLVETAKTKTTYTGTSSTVTLTFDNTTATFTNNKVGPFKISSSDANKLSNFALEVKDKDGNVITCTLEDATGNALEAKKEILGKEFYVVLTDNTLTEINVHVSAEYLATKTTKWTGAEGEQPVVIIEKVPVKVEDTKRVTTVEEFDLSLRKFITQVNDMEVTDRVPIVDITALKNGTSTTAKYTHKKTPVSVVTGDIVTYTLRIYNEGDIDGYASIVKDDIPKGLEFIIDNETNLEYGWKLSADGKSVTTDYLSKEKEEATDRDNLIKAYDSEKMTTLAYKDLEVVFKVVEPNTSNLTITNTAEIADDSDSTGAEVEDRDSTPDNNIATEDDIDVEHLILQYFDLALTKYLKKVEALEIIERDPIPVKVEDLEIIGRDPIPVVAEDGTVTYNRKAKEKPYEVAPGDVVVYGIRVYNEGLIDGYAKEVKDDIPEFLEFVEGHEVNTKYRWELSEDGKSIVTDYLSKEQEAIEGENLIKKFDPNTMEKPEYKEVLVAFKVLPPLEKGTIIINTAEISDDSDADGNDVTDVDSTPDNNKPEEDDIDTEKIYVRIFDLSLLKWVTKAIVVDNGETTVIETGHDGSENPEAPVKVEVNRYRINKVDIRFEFKIKVTNEGEIAGYAKEVKDYIPDGLEFVEEDNPQWTLESEKVAVTRQIENTLLKPGESAIITITLRWQNHPENMGLKTNTAEISEDDNENDAPDVDSVPDNKIEGEDDIDIAPVILSVKTGSDETYYTLIIAVSTILLVGVVFIKKFVLI